MTKMDRLEDCVMTNRKYVLSIGLAAGTLLAVLPFFVGGALLLVPALSSLIVQSGIVPGTGPALFVPLVPLSAIALATASFVISRGQTSFPVTGLLSASGILMTVPAVIATGNFASIAIPGPILGVIIGLAILGLGVAKGIGTAKRAQIIFR
jgi:hypothetical protein